MYPLVCRLRTRLSYVKKILRIMWNSRCNQWLPMLKPCWCSNERERLLLITATTFASRRSMQDALMHLKFLDLCPNTSVHCSAKGKDRFDGSRCQETLTTFAKQMTWLWSCFRMIKH